MNTPERAIRWLRLPAWTSRKRQNVLPFLERSERRQRWFKRTILTATALVAGILIGASPAGRYQVELWTSRARDRAMSLLFGLEPDRAQVEADWALRRRRGVEQTHQVLTRFYHRTSEPMRELFRTAGMDPDHGLVRWGRGDQAFLISPQVFDLDEKGRSYRMRPNTRSVWLRQITLHDGPFGMFQVLDTPEHRAAAIRAEAIVDEHSVQNTNSWGVRGAEPDLSAPLRGIVLGDSFMQAMFNGDDETPSVYLERYLRSARKVPVSILNTGHIGYSPEQYYYTLREYGQRMRPRFVVVSVCPNDFGDGAAVLRGEGDWFDEAQYWLHQIRQWCTSNQAILLLVPVPTYTQIEGIRVDEYYPGRVCNIFKSTSLIYCDPLNEFVDEHMKLTKLATQGESVSLRSQLFNRRIDDDHFSPRGAQLWAEIVGRRLTLLLDPTPPASSSTESHAPAAPIGHTSR
jgi:hypothetical protein